MTNTNTSNSKQSRMAKVVGILLVVALLVSSQAPAAKAGWKIKPDWSRVKAMIPGTRTTVLLYQDLAPRGKRKIKGRFHSATPESITILLGQGQTRTVEKGDVHRVLVYRPVGERTGAYIMPGVGSGLGLVVALQVGGGFATIGLFAAAFTVLGFLVIQKMKPIYNVPRNDQKRQERAAQGVLNRKGP